MALQANPTPNEVTIAIRQLQAASPIFKTVTLASSGWTATTTGEPSGVKYVISDADISSLTVVDFIQSNESAEAWANIEAYPATLSESGKVTLYAKTAPTSNITGYIIIFGVKSYEEEVRAAYPGYAILHGTIAGANGTPPNLTITSGTLAAGNKAVIIDSVTGLASGDPLGSVCTGQTQEEAAFWGGQNYPSVTPDISANTTLLLWNGSTLTSKENEEV